MEYKGNKPPFRLVKNTLGNIELLSSDEKYIAYADSDMSDFNEQVYTLHLLKESPNLLQICIENQKLLEEIILHIPSGDFRNKITNANILTLKSIHNCLIVNPEVIS